MQIIDPSPTNFYYGRMPKTVEGKTFIRAVDQAYQCRVLISKLITRADTKIKELAVLEAERKEGHSEDKDSLWVQKDLVDDHEQMKKKLKEHFNVTHEISAMESFIMRCRPDVPIKGDKIKENAKAMRDKVIRTR